MSFHVPNKWRVHAGPLKSTDELGNYGAFDIPSQVGNRRQLMVIASEGASTEGGQAWEHVSVHVDDHGRPRTPTWEEMAFVKGVFWDDEDVVVQFHPRKSEYVNCHEHTLHMWRPVGLEIPTPDPLMVGPR